MTLRRRANGALTVPIAGDATIVQTDGATPPSTAFAQISNTIPNQQSSASSDAGSSPGSGANPALNRAVIAVSVIMAVASIVVLIWYLRERRHDRNSVKEKERRIRLAQSPRSMLPLQTSFQPSLKSSFGFTGASPDSPWSRTQVGTLFSRPCVSGAGRGVRD